MYLKTKTHNAPWMETKMRREPTKQYQETKVSHLTEGRPQNIQNPELKQSNVYQYIEI